MGTNKDIERLHYYASLFSGNVAVRSLKYDDNSIFTQLITKYDPHLLGKDLTYWDYLAYAYKILEKNYQNEYVYKNTFISDWLIKKYSLKNTVAFSEFHIGQAIADLVLFNGSSKAFEIKTELDNDKRLLSQLEEYSKLVEECFIVVPEDFVSDYLTAVDSNIGILALKKSSRSLKIESRRAAKKNFFVDIDVLMSSVRCNEYKWMTEQAYGALPDVSCFEMFDACKELLGKLSSERLHSLFLAAVKKRKSITSEFKNIPRHARQFCLSLDLSKKNFSRLNELYNQRIVF